MTKLKNKVTSLFKQILNKFLITLFYNSNLCGLAYIFFNNSFEIRYGNIEFFKILGIKKSNYIKDYKKELLSIACENDIPLLNNLFVSNHKLKDNIKIEFKIKNSNNGNLTWVLLIGQCISIKNNNCKFLCILNDITDSKKNNQKLEIENLKLKVQLDPLTNLYNKTASQVLIDNFLSLNPSNYQALMIIDIDNFKLINDNLGHMVGDNILLNVSSTLISCFSRNDIIGRIGGDEFIILYKNFDTMESLSNKAYKLCNSIKSIYIDDMYKISCSIGICIFPTHGINYHELFKKSDHALFLAKRYGKDCFEIYDENKTDANNSDIFNFYSKNNLYQRYNNTFKNNLISYCFDILSETEDIDNAITLILSKIGEYFKLSRISIILYSDDDLNFKITHEWCNYQNNCYKDEMKNIQFRDWICYFTEFNNDNILVCNNYDNLKLPRKIKKLYDVLKIKSFLQYIIKNDSKISGAINYYNCLEEHLWTTNEIKLFTSITKILTSYLLKIRSTKYLEKELLLLQAMAKHENIYSYILKENTYELIYVSPNLKLLFPNTQCNNQFKDTCYKSFFDKDLPPTHSPLISLAKDKFNKPVEFFSTILETWISLSMSEILLPDNSKALLIYFSDITNFLDRTISKDPLTGLMAFPKFNIMANELLNKYHNNYALIYFDFNKFKYINEIGGYSVGNKVLVKVSSILINSIDNDELACRISSDNFLVLIKYSDIKNLKNKLFRFNEKVIGLQKEEFNNLKISIISGIYLINDINDEIFSIIDKANIARKTIKSSHKSQFAFYDSKLHLKFTKEKEIENRMVKALNNKEFTIFLQPKIELATKNLIGAEALVRWITPNNIVFYPNDFIPLFEKNGFIIELDFYVYEEVFKMLQSWINNNFKVIPISINVSRSHINSSDFISRLTKLIVKYNIPINLIELELTENIFLNNIKQVLNTINTLKSMGFTFSMDDFGSGYSSLMLLKELPIDVLKLDKSFFPNNTLSNKNKIITSNVVNMAKDLNIKVLCEGIETKEQIDFLIKIKCDIVQGYFFSKPIPIDEFIEKYKLKI